MFLVDEYEYPGLSSERNPLNEIQEKLFHLARKPRHSALSKASLHNPPWGKLRYESREKIEEKFERAVESTCQEKTYTIHDLADA